MGRSRLRLQNPWWRDVTLIRSDDLILAFENSKCRWFPELNIALDRDIIYSLRGPRQVGKTTYIKVAVMRLLEMGVEPRNVLYLYGEVFADWRELLESLEYYLKNVRSGRAYIFIDEISAVHDWPRAIKYLYDVGLLRRDFVLLCGSHAMDVVRGVELLPGRRGEYEERPDYVLLPMVFAEYVGTVKPELMSEINREVNLSSLESALESLYSFHSDLRGLFERFIVGGGFPHAQDKLLSSNSIPKRLYDDFIAYVKGDAHRERVSVTAMLQTGRRIIETMSSTISWRSLSHGTDYNYETIQRVAEFLRAAFVLEVIYQPKIARGVLFPDFRRDKKIYFIDPFILYAFDIWTTGSQSAFNTIDRWARERELRGKLVECIILRHLIEFLMRKKFSEEPLMNIFYARKNNREIDFIALGKSILFIESKLKRKRELYTPMGISHGKRAYIIMTSEDEFERRNGLLIAPLPEFLMVLSHRRMAKILALI